MQGFEGALVYYDAQMYAPERLALECLIEADANGATVTNYVEAKHLLLQEGKVEGCVAQDRMSGVSFDIRAQITIVAAGPWTDLFLERSFGRSLSTRVKRSKGIHVIVAARTRKFALTIATERGHFFYCLGAAIRCLVQPIPLF